MLAGAEEEAEGGFLAESQGGIPIRVAGVDFEGVGIVDQFNPGPFRRPGSGRRPACQFEGIRRVWQCGMHPGEAVRAAGWESQFGNQGRIGTRPGQGSAGQEDDRGQVRSAPGQDVHRLHVKRRQALPFQRSKLAAYFQQERGDIIRMIGDCKAPGQHCANREPSTRQLRLYREKVRNRDAGSWDRNIASAAARER